MKKTVLLISGSTKTNSTSHTILATIAAGMDERFEFTLFGGIDTLPHFNPDLDNESVPTEVSKFRDQIQRSDGVLFCTPEYVFSLPGSLKNAIEWCVSTTVFSNKPVAIIVAAANGVKALESLELIMTTIEAKVQKDTVLLIQGAKGKVSGGKIVADETVGKIKLLLD